VPAGGPAPVGAWALPLPGDWVYVPPYQALLGGTGSARAVTAATLEWWLRTSTTPPQPSQNVAVLATPTLSVSLVGAATGWQLSLAYRDGVAPCNDTYAWAAAGGVWAHAAVVLSSSGVAVLLDGNATKRVAGSCPPDYVFDMAR
jgi:hypothetical protein